jgi:hypothetical protein
MVAQRIWISVSAGRNRINRWQFLARGYAGQTHLSFRPYVHSNYHPQKSS